MRFKSILTEGFHTHMEFILKWCTFKIRMVFSELLVDEKKFLYFIIVFADTELSCSAFSPL